MARSRAGPATTFWRINLGWTRRANKELHGFMLDMERGRWEKSNLEPDASDEHPDPLGGRVHVERVIPFVEDRRNALLFQTEERLDRPALLSLQYALKRGIEACYQLESAELACEALSTDLEPSHLLLYESAEGGAGVLVRLAEESDALARAAREALKICHYDPDSGADLRRAERANEDCEAACYDCLLGYHNQRYHPLLDRTRLPALLLRLARTRAEVGAGGQTRETQCERLLRLCQSDLEREFLGWLYERSLRLPDRAQVTLDGGLARPDFVYDAALTCVYVDGAPHQFPERIARDAAQDRALENLGWTVVRVQGAESWLPRVRELPWVFGEPTTDQGQ